MMKQAPHLSQPSYGHIYPSRQWGSNTPGVNIKIKAGCCIHIETEIPLEGDILTFNRPSLYIYMHNVDRNKLVANLLSGNSC